MTVYIITDTHEDDLLFCVVCPLRGVSPVYRVPGYRGARNGNPYLVYGPQVEKWTKRLKYHDTLVVSRVTSGQLEHIPNPNEVLR